MGRGSGGGVFSDQAPDTGALHENAGAGIHLRTNEIWFSHPLLMNDPQEVAFGLNTAAQLLFIDERIKAACGSPQWLEILKNALIYRFNRFSKKHLPNTSYCVFARMQEKTTTAFCRYSEGGDQGKGSLSRSIRSRLLRGNPHDCPSSKE